MPSNNCFPYFKPKRQADVMIVAGTLTNKMAPALRKVSKMIPSYFITLLFLVRPLLYLCFFCRFTACFVL